MGLQEKYILGREKESETNINLGGDRLTPGLVKKSVCLSCNE